jgi:hypothetical protein
MIFNCRSPLHSIIFRINVHKCFIIISFLIDFISILYFYILHIINFISICVLSYSKLCVLSFIPKFLICIKFADMLPRCHYDFAFHKNS